MKVKNYLDSKPTIIDTDVAKGIKGRVLIGKKDQAKNFCMRLFELSEGGFTPRHYHDWEHEIFILSGNGAIYCEGKWIKINQNDSIFIPNNEEHQLKNIGKDSFKFICIIPSGVQEM